MGTGTRSVRCAGRTPDIGNVESFPGWRNDSARAENHRTAVKVIMRHPTRCERTLHFSVPGRDCTVIEVGTCSLERSWSGWQQRLGLCHKAAGQSNFEAVAARHRTIDVLGTVRANLVVGAGATGFAATHTGALVPCAIRSRLAAQIVRCAPCHLRDHSQSNFLRRPKALSSTESRIEERNNRVRISQTVINRRMGSG
jgi:hypothetical protein